MIIDIILLIFIVFSAYRGYKKGLISIVVSFVALILAIVLGFLFKEPVANYLYESTKFGKNIEESVNKVIEKNINSEFEKIDILNQIVSKKEIQSTQTLQQLSKSFTMFILKIISFVLILIGVYVICSLLQMLLNLFSDLPVIGTINKFGGAGINVLQLLVKIWIVLAIVYFIMPIQKTNTLKNFINSSVVTKALYENNFFISIIQNNIKI